ncbi:hypothetical protein [Shewanella sp. Iso12]|uniref:hypothetical protein n=1 Tax=Shewanella sp. Iso12 TaxID=1826753 RepID=UPI001431065B|nr:hypothetical protein [Shewanella sp. Iso12]NJI86956.1 hypothetical protein [Shewanella sp. Iso12]
MTESKSTRKKPSVRVLSLTILCWILILAMYIYYRNADSASSLDNVAETLKTSDAVVDNFKTEEEVEIIPSTTSDDIFDAAYERQYKEASKRYSLASIKKLALEEEAKVKELESNGNKQLTVIHNPEVEYPGLPDANDSYDDVGFKSLKEAVADRVAIVSVVSEGRKYTAHIKIDGQIIPVKMGDVVGDITVTGIDSSSVSFKDLSGKVIKKWIGI